MNETAVTATPSPSLKRRQSVDKNIENENYPPKKKRESAIRSENNLKMLIQNGQVDTYKPKVSPKKLLTLGRTEICATMINAGKEKLVKLYMRNVATASHVTREDVETSDSDPEPLSSPQPKNKLQSETPSEPKTTNTLKVQSPINTSNLSNLTNTSQVPKQTNEVSNLNKSKSLYVSISPIKVPNQTNMRNVATASHAMREDVETSDSDPEPLSPQPKNKIQSETPNEPKTINTLKVQNPVNTSNLSNLTNISQVPKQTTGVPNPYVSITPIKVPNQTNTSVSNKNSTTNVSNPEATNNKETPLLLDNYKTSNTCELVDSSIAVVSTKDRRRTEEDNLDESKEEDTDFDLNRSSLDAEVLALRDLILNLAPDKDDNGTEIHKTVDIKHIEDILKTVIKVKSKLNAVYQQKSIKLRKSFESIQLFVPEIERGLTLPTLQQLKEKSLVTGEEL